MLHDVNKPKIQKSWEQQSFHIVKGLREVARTVVKHKTPKLRNVEAMTRRSLFDPVHGLLHIPLPPDAGKLRLQQRLRREARRRAVESRVRLQTEVMKADPGRVAPRGGLAPGALGGDLALDARGLHEPNGAGARGGGT